MKVGTYIKQILCFVLMLLVIAFSSEGATACHNSSLSLVSYTDNGTSHDYEIQLCIGGGILGVDTGADGATESFVIALYKPGFGLSVSGITPSLTSTETGETVNGSIIGPQGAPFNSENNIFYNHSGSSGFTCITSTAQCGTPHSDCFNISFTTDLALDQIKAFGIEGNGNYSAGCIGEPDMTLDFTSALPVELSFFGAQSGQNGITLNWKTQTELNNDYFEIQRSEDGIRYSSIVKIPGNGTTFSEHQYTYLDQIPNNGRYYYRLKQVDFDGNYNYSPVTSIAYKGQNLDWVIFPNPASQYFQLSTLPIGVKMLQIVNAYGSIVRQYTLDPDFSGYAAFDIRGLDSGLYWLRAGEEVKPVIIK